MESISDLPKLGLASLSGSSFEGNNTVNPRFQSKC